MPFSLADRTNFEFAVFGSGTPAEPAEPFTRNCDVFFYPQKSVFQRNLDANYLCGYFIVTTVHVVILDSVFVAFYLIEAVCIIDRLFYTGGEHFVSSVYSVVVAMLFLEGLVGGFYLVFGGGDFYF